MKKILQALLIFCLILFTTDFKVLKAESIETWEEIRDKDWRADDTLTADNFDIIVEKIAEFNGINNFLGIFNIVIEKVKEIEEKFANIFSSDSGNVGIGTENSTETLEVAGNIKADKFYGDLDPYFYVKIIMKAQFSKGGWDHFIMGAPGYSCTQVCDAVTATWIDNNVYPATYGCNATFVPNHFVPRTKAPFYDPYFGYGCGYANSSQSLLCMCNAGGAGYNFYELHLNFPAIGFW